MPASKPIVLVLQPEVGPREITLALLNALGLDARSCVHGDEAVELSLLGKVDAILFGGAPDMPASLLVDQIRYGGAFTGIVCWLNMRDPDYDGISQDPRTRVIGCPTSVRRITTAIEAVSPACRRAIAAHRARKAAA
jgi:hypothetical protein